MRESKRYLVLLCMLGFFVGIMCANLVPKEYITSMGILNDFFLNQYNTDEIEVTEYLWYIIRVRCTPLILMAAIGYGRLRKILTIIFLLWTSFAGGLIMAAAVLKMGLKGMVLCLVALTPHFFFYIAGYMILLWYFFSYPTSKWNASKTICMILFVAVGVLLESYVNPMLMQLFLRTL